MASGVTLMMRASPTMMRPVIAAQAAIQAMRHWIAAYAAMTGWLAAYAGMTEIRHTGVGRYPALHGDKLDCGLRRNDGCVMSRQAWGGL